MKWNRYPDAASLLAAMEPVLLKEEARHQIFLGSALNLAKHPDRTPNTAVFAALYDDNRPVLGLLDAPPYPLILAPVGVRQDRALLAEQAFTWLASHHPSAHHIMTETPLALCFVEHWRTTLAPGEQLTCVADQRVHQITAPPAPPSQPGRLRQATRNDLVLATAWARAFFAEAMPTEADRDFESETGRRLADGFIYFWEIDGEPVAQAAKARPSHHACALTLVYTPPEQRGRGYGGAVTRALSRAILAEGMTRCVLLTDLANPVSNHIYARIGYKPVCDLKNFKRIKHPERD